MAVNIFSFFLSSCSLCGLYKCVQASITEHTAQKPVCLVLDDLSVLLSVGVSEREIVSFVRYCWEMVTNQDRCSLVSVSHDCHMIPNLITIVAVFGSFIVLILKMICDSFAIFRNKIHFDYNSSSYISGDYVIIMYMCNRGHMRRTCSHLKENFFKVRVDIEIFLYSTKYRNYLQV